jgi:hypothetical protein
MRMNLLSGPGDKRKQPQPTPETKSLKNQVHWPMQDLLVSMVERQMKPFSEQTKSVGRHVCATGASVTIDRLRSRRKGGNLNSKQFEQEIKTEPQSFDNANRKPFNQPPFNQI